MEFSPLCTVVVSQLFHGARSIVAQEHPVPDVSWMTDVSLETGKHLPEQISYWAKM